MVAPKTKDKADRAGKTDLGDEGQQDLSFLLPVLGFKPDGPGRDPLGAVRGTLQRLCGRDGQSPPQTLLIEGGTPETRLAAALYWAGLFNCAAGLDESLPAFMGEGAGPCWACPAPRTTWSSCCPTATSCWNAMRAR